MVAMLSHSQPPHGTRSPTHLDCMPVGSSITEHESVKQLPRSRHGMVRGPTMSARDVDIGAKA